jgi:hypothetical protein
MIMKRRIFSFAALMLISLLPGVAPAFAQETPLPPPPPPVISTTASSDYPAVTCTSSDALACADTLQLAEETRDQLTGLLKLGREWRFAVHIHIMTPDDPLLAKVNREAAAVFAQGSTMKIEAVLPSTDPNPREFIQRQFVTALLWEKFFATTKTFDKDTKLDTVPVWLVEGLREWLNDDPEHNRESIVKRAVKNQMAPTLEAVTGWHELSTDRVLGLWQRSFCFYLVESITQNGARRDDFQQWLDGYSGANPTTAQLHFPTEADWQRELVDATTRSHDVVYTWAETLSQLTAAQTITFVSPKDGKVQTCTMDDILKAPANPTVGEAIQERIFFLTQLELRAHPSWNPVLELYRSALTALVKDYKPDLAQKLLLEAHRRSVEEMDHHQKLLDYMNWFEVAKDNSGNATHFGAYFSTAQEMERVQADPAHPNPIRANLLQIESEL